MSRKYKVSVHLQENLQSGFVPLLKKYGMEPTGHLVTAWDTFSKKPGRRRAPRDCRVSNLGAGGPLKELCKIGMYKG